MSTEKKQQNAEDNSRGRCVENIGVQAAGQAHVALGLSAL